jgi:hypothetical protein
MHRGLLWTLAALAAAAAVPALRRSEGRAREAILAENPSRDR